MFSNCGKIITKAVGNIYYLKVVKCESYREQAKNVEAFPVLPIHYFYPIQASGIFSM